MGFAYGPTGPRIGGFAYMGPSPLLVPLNEVGLMIGTGVVTVGGAETAIP